jgi:hypothetical protein
MGMPKSDRDEMRGYYQSARGQGVLEAPRNQYQSKEWIWIKFIQVFMS